MEKFRLKDELVKDEYEFINDSACNRSGFYHESVLLRFGHEIARCKIQYYNRTWECYRFQTSMRTAVEKILDSRYKELLSDYKEKFNITRLTKIKKEDFEKYFNSLADIKELNLIIEDLKR